MSAKQGLLKWLGAFVAFDVVVLGSILGPQLIDTPETAAKITGVLTTFLVPPVLFLINNVVPQTLKFILVFWRLRDVLPGHRAFSKHATNDPRISVSKLTARIGAFPIAPREQQEMWYSIYQKHKTDPAVLDAHRPFLIFRDLAALSLLLALVTPLALWFGGLSMASCSAFAVFSGQYLLAAVASRQAGVRLVCTVLSIESHCQA